MTKQRLARLEKAVQDLDGRPCTLCWGQPITAVHVDLKPDPHGPGFRRVAETLLESHQDRVTEPCDAAGAELRQRLPF